MMMQLLILVLTIFTLHDSVCAFEPPSIFPASMRQALAEKSKSINPQPQSSYTTAGFSNRAGTCLTPIYPGIYTADRPFLWNGIDVMGRAAIVELPCNDATATTNKPDLWVHSPIALDGPLQKALDQLGIVKYVVSPNYEHVKYAAQWARAYPDATIWACPGLAAREPGVPWTGEIPDGYRPRGYKGKLRATTTDDVIKTNDPSRQFLLWDANVIETLHVDVEVNPFTGKPFFNECVFYHAPTKSLYTTDLFWNYPANAVPNSQWGQNDSWELAPAVDDVPFGSKAWKFGMDKIYRPFYNNIMVQDRAEYRAIANHIINVWDVELVVPAHGDILRGKKLIQRVLSEFLNYKE
jgi:hypothetical protein